VHEADVLAASGDREQPQVAAQAVAHGREVVDHRVVGLRGRQLGHEQPVRQGLGVAGQVLAHDRGRAVGADHDLGGQGGAVAE
jgi:hypothetical protein